MIPLPFADTEALRSAGIHGHRFAITADHPGGRTVVVESNDPNLGSMIASGRYANPRIFLRDAGGWSHVGDVVAVGRTSPESMGGAR